MLSKRFIISGTNFVVRQNFSRTFSKTDSLKLLKKLNTSHKFKLLGSAAAIGISAYIVQKNRINCDAENENVIDLIEAEKIEKNNLEEQRSDYEEAIKKSRDILLRVKDEVGAPGIIVGVSIDGKTIWTEGLGYADIENRVLCSADTVMRIASISKSITMAAVAKLIEQGKLDLDKPIQEYVPTFPQKTFDGKPVVITGRHLVSHMAGIRHYEKNANQNENKGSKNNNEKNKKDKGSDFEYKEFYIKEKHDVKSSLNLFKDDPLIAKPGTKFNYTTHGWTVVSAIVEAVSKEEFPRHMNKLFKTLGMKNTYLDENDNIIYYRSRNYEKNKKGHLVNAPYVDNSYKWAGGGFLSTVPDLLKFANAMLYSFQFDNKHLDEKRNKSNGIYNSSSNTQKHHLEEKLLPGFLNSKTMETVWTPVVNCSENIKYAMGWVALPEKQDCQFCEEVKFCVYHTGGAIGASSILLILPKSLSTNELSVLETDSPPKGVIVTIITNLSAVNLTNAALKIAEIFDNQ